MYHHDLTYSTWLLKAKHNKVNIGIGSVSLIGIVLCCYLIFFASTTVTTEIKTLTGLDLFIGGFMIVGMTIGGLMLVLKFSKLRLLMLCTFVFGCGLIMFREELAMFLLPYLNDYLTFLLLFPLVLMIVYVVLYSKKDKTKQIRTNVR